MTKINPNILPGYMEKFYGCGNLKAPLWFVGMEPGGTPDVTMFNQKLDWWNMTGQPNTTDVLPEEIEGGRTWFRCERPNLQRTLYKLIRANLGARGIKATPESARKYQADDWGRPNGDAAFLELMPLAAHSTNSWPYPDISDIAELASRKAYMTSVLPKRISGLRELIAKNTPKAVVFHGAGYFPHWKEISGQHLDWKKTGFGHRTKHQFTTFFSIPHPTSHGATNLQFDKLGEDLKAIIA